jgi:hypothetical protein
MTDRQPPSATGGADVEAIQELLRRRDHISPRADVYERMALYQRIANEVPGLLDAYAALRAERESLRADVRQRSETAKLQMAIIRETAKTEVALRARAERAEAQVAEVVGALGERMSGEATLVDAIRTLIVQPCFPMELRGHSMERRGYPWD